MDKRQTDRGQTIVELAIVLPCFCLGVFMGVQLMWCCHNFVELQRMAQVMIDRVTLENYQSRKKYTRFTSLWGEYEDPWGYFDTVTVQPWRPFNGVSTFKETGRFFRVHVDSELFHGEGFTNVLANVPERAYAETFIEPPIPAEQ